MNEWKNLQLCTHPYNVSACDYLLLSLIGWRKSSEKSWMSDGNSIWNFARRLESNTEWIVWWRLNVPTEYAKRIVKHCCDDSNFTKSQAPGGKKGETWQTPRTRPERGGECHSQGTLIHKCAASHSRDRGVFTCFHLQRGTYSAKRLPEQIFPAARRRPLRPAIVCQCLLTLTIPTCLVGSSLWSRNIPHFPLALEQVVRIPLTRTKKSHVPGTWILYYNYVHNSQPEFDIPNHLGHNDIRLVYTGNTLRDVPVAQLSIMPLPRS